MIFTIEGNIGSGKTTILKELEALKFGKRHIVVYEQVKEWADMKDKDGNDILSLFYKDKIKYSYIFQSYVLFSRINHLVQTIKNNPDAVIICERCHLTDLYVFAKSLYESNDLSEIEWNVYNLWHKQLRELLSIRLDGIIYIKTDPEVCYERIKQRNREGENITNYLEISMNDEFVETKSRNIIKALFISEIERHPASSEILTKEFVELNFPPFVEFIKNFNKNKNNLEDIRGLSYKCCQFNISILQIVQDFLRLVDFENYYLNIRNTDADAKIKLKCEIIQIGTEIDYLLSQTNKCKEPLYIENLLCQLLV